MLFAGLNSLMRCYTKVNGIGTTLLCIFFAVISQIGRESKGYSELAYRTEPIIADIIMALVDLGITMEGLQVSMKCTRSVLIL